MDSVRADNDVRRRAPAVLELQFDAMAGVVERRQFVTKMNAFGRHRIGKHCQHVRTMDGVEEVFA